MSTAATLTSYSADMLMSVALVAVTVGFVVTVKHVMILLKASLRRNPEVTERKAPPAPVAVVEASIPAKTSFKPLKLKDDLATVAAVAAFAVLADCRAGLQSVGDDAILTQPRAEPEMAEVVGMHTLLRAARPEEVESEEPEEFAVSSEENSSDARTVSEQLSSRGSSPDMCPELLDSDSVSACSSMPSLEDVEIADYEIEAAPRDQWHPLHSTGDSVHPLGSLEGAFSRLTHKAQAPAKIIYLDDNGDELLERPSAGNLMMFVADQPFSQHNWAPSGFDGQYVSFDYVQPLQPVA
eukprot:TRINITY_DN493_c0_g2_i1.p1 TRINITY_DN493_c0_g2~~TRINITY_DN493_c0_g2_i1.p1  ORF type:complete len:296 (+),score=82.41 TRINITY_DN493_c0_g2_i1:165-1052(+)